MADVLTSGSRTSGRGATFLTKMWNLFDPKCEFYL